MTPDPTTEPEDLAGAPPGHGQATGADDPQGQQPDGGTDPADGGEATPADGPQAVVDTDAYTDRPLPDLTPEEAAEALAERDELKDRLLRARADFDNLNKRRQREVAEARDRGAAALAERLLEVLDNFGFALQAAATSSDASLGKGVALVHSQLVAALSDAGLSEVPGAGEVFDPAHHEALMSHDDGVEREHPEVAEVLRTGYRFKDQLLRPASVKVLS